jgi:glycine betaine/proline transport system ATP-binding protein
MLRLEGVSKVFGPIRRFDVRQRRFVDPRREALNRLAAGEDRSTVEDALHVNVALRDVNIDVNKGEIFVLMGLSGCGKSTLLRCVNRLIRPSFGHIYLDGEDITTMDAKRLREVRRTKISMVFQHFGLLPHRTVLDNVAFGLEVQGLLRADRYARASAMLETVGLADRTDAFPHELSGGMKQRVGLARALVSEPDLLLMDEPFSALDPLIRTSLQQEIIDLQRRLGLTILLVTHDLDEALHMGDRIAILSTPDEKGGNVMQVGEPADIALRPEGEYVSRFVRDLNRVRVLTASDMMWVPETVGRVTEDPVVLYDRMDRRGLESLPIVSERNVLVGRLTRTAARTAARSEASTADFVEALRTVEGDCPVEEVTSLLLTDDSPLGVVDAGGAFLGIVRSTHIVRLFESGVNSDDE